MSGYYVPITEWTVDERPREKLLQRGIDALTDAELIAILLGSGTRKLSAVDLARQVLREANGLDALARSGVSDLTQVKGIGPAKAIALVAAFELGRRRIYSEQTPARISSSELAAQYLKARLADLKQEVFYVLFLSRSNEILAEKQMFKGGVSSTVVDQRLLFKEAISHLASAIIVAHNHPSGNLKPSKADIQITHKLAQTGNTLDIRLLDHIIVSSRGHFSFADEGMLEP